MLTNKIIIKTKKINKDGLLYALLSLLVVIIMIILLISPTIYSKSVLDGLNMFIICVLPGLLPFMLLTKLLTNFGYVQKLSNRLYRPTKLLFNTSGIASYVFIMSILSGYPIGAKIICDLYQNNQISYLDAKKTLSFATTSGPIFIIGSVGATMFGNQIIGVIIYLSHILSSIMCGIIFAGKRLKRTKNENFTNLTKVDNILSSSISDTVQNILIVGTYITIFFLLSDILINTKIIKIISYPLSIVFNKLSLPDYSVAIISGLLEVTRGVKMLSLTPNVISACLSCALISFSGVSIILQSMNFISKCKIKARYFIFVKSVHCILSFLICFIMCKIFIF